MAVREFDGTDDQIVLSGGALGAIGNGAYSIVLLVKPTTLTDARFSISLQVSTTNVLAALQKRSSGNLDLASDAGGSVGLAGLTAGDWQVIGVSKAAGTTFPRMHRAVRGSGAWTHDDGDAQLANVAGTCSRIEVGSKQNAAFDDFRIAIAAVFNTDIGDSGFETIDAGGSTAGVIALGPLAMWEFDQAVVTDPVNDLMAGGANQTARTGTTVITDDDQWNFAASAGNPNVGDLRFSTRGVPMRN